MSLISTWSTIADDNGTLGTTPQYWPEGQPPSSVNDCARLMMSTIRTQWNDAQWFNWGYTVTRLAGNQFQVVSASWNTVTIANVFQVDGRIKLYDTSTLYGTITEVSISASVTNVTFTPDSGSLTASFSSVYNSIITPDLKALPGGNIPANVVRQTGAQLYAADAGVSDAYAIAMSPTVTALQAGQFINFMANTQNTGTATLTVDGLGPYTIYKNKDQTLADGDIKAGQIVTVMFDGTNFQMQSQLGTSSSGGASAATQAEQEAGTSTAVYVSPGRQQYHNSALKMYLMATSLGTIAASYNISSLVDNGTGIITVIMTNGFSSVNYPIVGSAGKDATTSNFVYVTIAHNAPLVPTATTFVGLCAYDSANQIDPNFWYFMAAGDQS